MSTPESIPEDKKQSFPCDCGGSISKNWVWWECDTCDFREIDKKAGACLCECEPCDNGECNYDLDCCHNHD